ncbi:MAG TPA: hypothetical protein VEM41_01505, partial [Actinomycetota bacterium]|nr:hypothetical protein [Actinomycetota bacterium]
MNSLPRQLPEWVTALEAAVLTGTSEADILEAAKAGRIRCTPLKVRRGAPDVILVRVNDVQAILSAPPLPDLSAPPLPVHTNGSAVPEPPLVASAALSIVEVPPPASSPVPGQVETSTAFAGASVAAPVTAPPAAPPPPAATPPPPPVVAPVAPSPVIVGSPPPATVAPPPP